MADMVTVIFNPMNRVVRVIRGSTVLDAIREAGIQFESICGGKGECGKCRVIRVRGSCEQLPCGNCRGLTVEETRENYCLACMTRILGDCEFVIPVESRIDLPQILLTAGWKPGDLTPSSAKYLTAAPDAADNPYGPRSLRLVGYTRKRPHMTKEQHDRLVGSLSPLTVIVSSATGYPEVIGIEDGDTTRANYGIAIDLGTTTVVGALVDLTDGSVIVRGSVLNGQITYGEELITRIAAAKDKGGRELLQAAVIESIRTVIAQLVTTSGIDPAAITDACIAGNTVMIYLLAGLDPRVLELVDGEISRLPILMKACELRLPVHPGAYVYCLPSVSRFVGGDAIGDVVVSGMHKSRDLSLLIDLGTNGELVLGNDEWLASASCASGPAFEGAGIVAGMRAMRGAIEHVAIDPGTGHVSVKTVGDGKPRGICGSGIIDAAAGMVSAGILDFTGKIVEGKPGVRRGESGPEFVLVGSNDTATGRDILISSPDMAYLMDSKAAACGAIGVLMNKYRVTPGDIRHVWLAGAFGAYADMGSVTAFGIIPDFYNAEYHPVGNGSLAGACAALVSREKRREAEDVARKMVYIDLLVESEFMEEYSAAMYIPGKKEYFTRQ
jgi:uncharacterized 2Fe-2S/4Fe-4S cluster protein (DUF4445 family)